MVMIGMVAVVLTCERAFFDSIIPCWITHACYNTAMMCLLAVGLAGEAFVKVYYYAHVYRALLPAHWRF